MEANGLEAFAWFSMAFEGSISLILVTAIVILGFLVLPTHSNAIYVMIYMIYTL